MPYRTLHFSLLKEKDKRHAFQYFERFLSPQEGLKYEERGKFCLFRISVKFDAISRKLYMYLHTESFDIRRTNLEVNCVSKLFMYVHINMGPQILCFQVWVLFLSCTLKDKECRCWTHDARLYVKLPTIQWWHYYWNFLRKQSCAPHVVSHGHFPAAITSVQNPVVRALLCRRKSLTSPIFNSTSDRPQTLPAIKRRRKVSAVTQMVTMMRATSDAPFVNDVAVIIVCATTEREAIWRTAVQCVLSLVMLTRRFASQNFSIKTDSNLKTKNLRTRVKMKIVFVCCYLVLLTIKICTFNAESLCIYVYICVCVCVCVLI